MKIRNDSDLIRLSKAIAFLEIVGASSCCTQTLPKRFEMGSKFTEPIWRIVKFVRKKLSGAFLQRIVCSTKLVLSIFPPTPTVSAVSAAKEWNRIHNQIFRAALNFNNRQIRPRIPCTRYFLLFQYILIDCKRQDWNECWLVENKLDRSRANVCFPLMRFFLFITMTMFSWGNEVSLTNKKDIARLSSNPVFIFLKINRITSKIGSWNSSPKSWKKNHVFPRFLWKEPMDIYF